MQPQNRDSGPSPQCLFNLLSAYCDNISLSCSLQNNEVRLPPPDWRGAIVPAFEKTYVTQRGMHAVGRGDGRKKRKEGEMSRIYDRGWWRCNLFSLPPPPSEDFWWPNPSYTVHHSSTFASRPSKGQAGRRYITITHLLGKLHHRSAEGASRGTKDLTHSNRCFSTT